MICIYFYIIDENKKYFKICNKIKPDTNKLRTKNKTTREIF